MLWSLAGGAAAGQWALRLTSVHSGLGKPPSVTRFIPSLLAMGVQVSRCPSMEIRQDIFGVERGLGIPFPGVAASFARQFLLHVPEYATRASRVEATGAEWSCFKSHHVQVISSNYILRTVAFGAANCVLRGPGDVILYCLYVQYIQCMHALTMHEILAIMS